eukprot:5890100-Prymnesium_polylepis.1
MNSRQLLNLEPPPRRGVWMGRRLHRVWHERGAMAFPGPSCAPPACDPCSPPRRDTLSPRSHAKA